MAACLVCGKPTVVVDYPEVDVYHLEDTEWLVSPFGDEDIHDPGVLGAKAGTLPLIASCLKTPR